jgi:hypothetical protein
LLPGAGGGGAAPRARLDRLEEGRKTAAAPPPVVIDEARRAEAVRREQESERRPPESIAKSARIAKNGSPLRPDFGGPAPSFDGSSARINVPSASLAPPPLPPGATPSAAAPSAGPAMPSVTAPATGPGPRPSPPPAAAAETAQPLNTAAYWNTWFVQGTGPASNILIANLTYTYVLDLAAFNYAALRRKTESSGVKAGAAVQAMLADTSTPEVILNIKPIVPEGSGLRLVDAKDSYPIKIDLKKIREPDGKAATQYANGDILITKLSELVSAGSIQFTVTAESKGCATIAFAIFRGLLPLDHLVQRVAIGDTSTSAPLCDSDDPARGNALTAGLESLREVTLGMEGSGASVTAAAALHIFDFDGYSMAVFVDGRPGKQSVYGWQTASSVVDFLKTDSFQNLILKARKDAADKKTGSYVRAAQDLSKILFSTKPRSSTETDAKNAQAAFRAIVKDSAGPPVIVVRVASSTVGGQNKSIYVPLGILGAKGPGAVLDKPIIVVQPMALERYPSRDKCIGEWMFAVPDGLENVPGTVMPPGFFPTKIPGMRISDIDRLREYLAAATVTGMPLLAPPPTAVGFVVLAHQDEGFLWFEASTNHIMPQDIEKKFPSGSVAIFSACSAASPKGRNTALLQRLNEQGIDTLIASPFTIDAGYGVVFASSFAEVVAETTTGTQQPTILELFDKTIARTAQKFKDRIEADYAELGLEYVLLGNPAIKLCPPSQ